MANRSSFRDLDPAARAGLASRISMLIDSLGSQTEAADVAQVSVRQLRMYTSGETAPSLLAVARLCRAAGWNLEWVATGEGCQCRTDATCATPQQINPRLCGRIVDAIAKAYRKMGIDLPNQELGRMAAEEHTKVAPLAVTDDQQIAVAKMVRQKYERMLAERAEAVPSKRRA